MGGFYADRLEDVELSKPPGTIGNALAAPKPSALIGAVTVEWARHR